MKCNILCGHFVHAETFDNAQKAKVKHAKAEEATACSSVSQQQPATVLGSRHDANLSAGGSCDFAPKTHDSQVIPGLPPLPELPFPPTHSTSVQYSSAVVGREGGLHSATVEEVAGKSASISQPCERPPACRKTPTPMIVVTQAKSKKDSALFNPAGLSTSDQSLRVSCYCRHQGRRRILGSRSQNFQMSANATSIQSWDIWFVYRP